MKSEEELKASVAKMFLDAHKRVVQIDSKMCLFVGEKDAKVDAAIDKALKEGRTVSENGTTRWIEFYPDIDTTKEGSEMYTWNKHGNKVRGDLVLFTRDDKSSTVSRSTIRTAWRKFEDA